jgi:hypothetical protein
LHPDKLLASTVDWTIATGATMAGGASVAGSFDYDATSNTYSNVAIIVWDHFSPPNTVPGDTYITEEVLEDSYDLELDLFDTSANTGFQLYFESALTDAGGVVPTGLHLLVGDDTVDLEYPGDIPFNTSVSRPEPKTVLMLVLGMLAMAGAHRLRAGRNQ